jgi:hypothetical protein
VRSTNVFLLFFPTLIYQQSSPVLTLLSGIIRDNKASHLDHREFILFHFISHHKSEKVDRNDEKRKLSTKRLHIQLTD